MTYENNNYAVINTSRNCSKDIRSTVYLVLFCLLWGGNTTFGYLRAFLSFSDIFVAAYDFLMYFLILISIICLLKRILYSFAKDFLILIPFLIFYILSAFFLFSSNVDITLFKDFLFKVFPMYFLGRIIFSDDVFLKKFKKTLCWLSRICVLLSFAYTMIYYTASGRSWSLMDGMDSSYSVLPSLMFVCFSFAHNKRIVDLLLSVLGTIEILALGTRGALLVIIVWAAYCFIFEGTHKKRNLLITITLFAIFIIGYYSGIFSSIINLMSGLFFDGSYNLTILDALSNKNIADDNGRLAIINEVYSNIKLNGLIPGGFFSDRIMTSTNSYSHNFFIELLAAFGFALFPFVMLSLIAFFINAIKNAQDAFINRVIFLLLIYEIIKLFLSSSFLLEPLFFLLLGICRSTSIFCSKEKRYVMDS